MDVKETHILGDAIGEHWYYRAKSAALRRMIAGMNQGTILDIGAGSGFFAKDLLRRTGATRAICVDSAYAADRDETCEGKPILFRRSSEGVGDVDLMLLMDVLEHVDDDASLLRGSAAAVKRGANIVISVPAFQFLWSGHDVFLEHRRRYTIASLSPLILAAGLELIRAHYYFAGVFPLAAGLRLFERFSSGRATVPESRLRRHAPLTNAILAGLCAVERPFMRFNKLAGLSVFALCRKP